MGGRQLMARATLADLQTPVPIALREPRRSTLISPRTASELEQTRSLFSEYASQLGIDLCFQDFEHELASLPGAYKEPSGALRLLIVEGEPAGCCAMRRLDNVDYPNACEMKRLYVRQDYRGGGWGRRLAESILQAATLAGYDFILLDTLDDMETARSLYAGLGFEEIPPYYHNPIPGAHYLMARLG